MPMRDSLQNLPANTRLTNPNNKNVYRIDCALKAGGFGIVYAAWDEKNKRRVAIKEYFPDKLVQRALDFHSVVVPDPDDDEFVERQKKRFSQEARIMQQFRGNENIVSVMDYFEANATAYIVMEFIDGQTFMQVLKNTPDGRMSLQSVLANLKPVFDALDKLHTTYWSDDNKQRHKGIVHRDISPDNIMFPSKGPVKLLDFGAARPESTNGTRKLTEVFKEGYAPFEQHLTKGPQGSWTDVYALAATIYRAITGVRPPDSRKLDNGEETLVPPSAFGIDITSQQEQALLKGMALDYRERYQTAGELYKAFTADVVMPEPRDSVYKPKKPLAPSTENKQTPKEDGKYILKLIILWVAVVLTGFCFVIIIMKSVFAVVEALTLPVFAELVIFIISFLLFIFLWGLIFKKIADLLGIDINQLSGQ